MFDDENVAGTEPLAALSQGLNQLVNDRRARDDFIRESDRDESDLANFACLCHRFAQDCGDFGYTASAAVASRSAGKFQLRARRWERVSPGRDRSCRRSGGLSTSTAIPGRFKTTQRLPVACAAA